jgi:hypothetical protein
MSSFATAGHAPDPTFCSRDKLVARRPHSRTRGAEAGVGLPRLSNLLQASASYVTAIPHHGECGSLLVLRVVATECPQP